MTKQEIMVTKVGELRDMISCLAIYSGSANPKKKQRNLSFEEQMGVI